MYTEREREREREREAEQINTMASTLNAILLFLKFEE